MTAKGWDVWGQIVDVGDRTAMAAAFDGVAAKHGRIDTVFANAGIDPGPGFMTRSRASATRMAPSKTSRRAVGSRDRDQSDLGLHDCEERCTPHEADRAAAQIIVTSSIAAHINESIVGTSYMPAKAAVNHFVRHMAMELGAYGIRINCISPGPFITNIAGGRLRNAADRKAFESQSLLGRIGDPEEIKGLALYLASPASSYVTGSLIVIDGGSCCE